MNQTNSSYKSLSFLTLVIFLMTVTLGACAASGEAVPAFQGSSSVPTEEPASTAIPSPATFNENMLKNASYSLPDIGEVQLKEGHFEQKYGEGATQVNQVDFNNMAVGDLNNDGMPDAAVILAVNTGGTGVFEYLVILLNQGGQPVQTATELLGDRVRIKSFDIQQNQVALNFLGFGPNDPMCCPTQVTLRTYALQDGGLKLLNEISATATP